MRELTTHLCKRLVAEHYAAIGAANGSDSGEPALFYFFRFLLGTLIWRRLLGC